MSVTEIRFAGFGGQGVIMMATVIGEAACIFENGYSTMTQAFGPEARGGAASAQVVLSDQPVLYPYVTEPNILVVMAQEAYTKFSPEVRSDGILIVETDLVRVTTAVKPGVRVYGVPATRLAEQLGKKMVLNIVMTGFFTAVTGLLAAESVRNAVLDSVPAHSKDLNLRAFEAGFAYGQKVLEGSVTDLATV